MPAQPCRPHRLFGRPIPQATCSVLVIRHLLPPPTSATATPILTVQAAGEDSFLGAAIGDELRRQVAARDPGQQAALRFLSRQLQADALPVGGCVLS